MPCELRWNQQDSQIHSRPGVFVMMTSVTKTRPSKTLTLKDRLSHLSLIEAGKLLGSQGVKLIQSNANKWDIQISQDVFLGDDLFRVRFPRLENNQPAIVSVTLMAEVRNRLHWNCSSCHGACDHVAAAFSLILEEKTALGLAAPPPERAPLESLGEVELVDLALEERAERARTEKMDVKSADPTRPWTDYTVTNRTSGRSYRVALRGLNTGDSFCSCPDFRTNTLGTCKHVMKVIGKVRRRFSADLLARPHRSKHLALRLDYVGEVTLRLAVPLRVDDETARIIEPLRDRPILDINDLMARLTRLQKTGADVVIYPDAEEYIEQRLFIERMRSKTEDIRRNAANHPLRETLLKIPLLPYQLDGVAFAAGVGRAVLADDMGLGKTIQGVGVAEFLARESNIRKVLVVCPASLKSQWRTEIGRFCNRDVQLVVGATANRTVQYSNDCFFTICNYEQVLRDILAVETVKWDLIILDEGQRIKNWESKTAATIKSLKSRFALVLTGTPLENRLDELYSVVQFIDDRRLGPGFRFFNRHRMVDEKGKVLGYKNLTQLREALQPVLLRRTRESVRLELPPRTTDYIRIPPSDEQLSLHTAHMQVVASIVRKPFISEMDLLRLQKALLMCRMAADSTLLVDKQPPGYSTKLAYLDELFDRLFEEEGRKVVLFSEWTTMLDQIQLLLDRRKLGYVRLDRQVPQKKRAELVATFQNDPSCRLFLTTNAGSTGLNLQAANTVVNVDLPWNPAVLEQRVARAHRMGQVQPVQVFVLITEGTIEEGLLQTLASKKELSLAALDIESEVDKVEMQSGLQDLKRRLEILLGARPDAAVDESEQRKAADAVRVAAENQRERVAAAGGELLGAAFKFLGELVAQQPAPPPAAALVANLREGLAACVDDDPTGKPRLTVTLPDRSALESLAQTLAQLLAAGAPATTPPA